MEDCGIYHAQEEAAQALIAYVKQHTRKNNIEYIILHAMSGSDK